MTNEIGHFIFQHLSFFTEFSVFLARMSPLFILVSFLKEHIFHGRIIKNTIVLFLYLGLYPKVSINLNNSPELDLPLTIMSELIIGTLFGLCINLPFWIASAIGEYIDNQRGANMGDILDPATASEASLLSSFIHMFTIAWFFLQGGLIIFLEVIVDSYQLFPVGQFPSSFNVFPMMSLLTKIATLSLIIAAPMLIVMFIIEVSLGAYSLFCQQMNAFSLALGLKTFAAFSLLFLLIQTIFPHQLTPLFELHSNVTDLIAAGKE